MSAAERVVAAETLEAMRHYAQTTTEFMERLAGQAINNVLEVWSGVIPPEGYLPREYNVAAGAVQVNNLGVLANVMTVSSTSPTTSGTAPSGTGTFVVAGGTCRTVPLASHNFTVYGTAGDRISIAVFTAGPRPVTH